MLAWVTRTGLSVATSLGHLRVASGGGKLYPPIIRPDRKAAIPP